MSRKTRHYTPIRIKIRQILTDFQYSFTDRLSRKFATKSHLNTPPHRKRVATLPCEISMFKKSQCSRSKWGTRTIYTLHTQLTTTETQITGHVGFMRHLKTYADRINTEYAAEICGNQLSYIFYGMSSAGVSCRRR